MAEEIKANETAPKEEAKAETPKEPTLEELKAQIAALTAEKEKWQSDSAKQKKAMSEANSQAAEYKRKYRETLDETERAKQEQAELLESLKTENAAYKARETANAYFAKLVAAGYDSDTASKMVAELPEGIPDSFFESQKSFLEAKTQAIKTQTLNSQPNLPTGAPLTGTDARLAEENKIRGYFGLPPINKL